MYVNNKTSYDIICFIGECQCDSGITNLTCPTQSDNPQIVMSDFDDADDVIPFPVTYGAIYSNECGVVSSGRSLVFKYVSLAPF